MKCSLNSRREIISQGQFYIELADCECNVDTVAQKCADYMNCETVSLLDTTLSVIKDSQATRGMLSKID